MSKELAVEIKNVNKSYGGLKALDNVSLNIKKGQFFGLLGANGAGKSTLINILAGLVKPSDGSVSIMGYDVKSQYRQARHSVGLVPQELVDEPFFEIERLLHLQSGYFGIHHNKKWIDELLEVMALSQKAQEKMSSLSGGMKRRLLIAMALVHQPAVVILDEPTAGVDVNMRRSLWKFINRLHQLGHTIILTTHYLEEAEHLCDHIAIIDDGKIVALESKDSLIKRYGDKKLEQIFIDLVGEDQ